MPALSTIKPATPWQWYMDNASKRACDTWRSWDNIWAFIEDDSHRPQRGLIGFL